MRISNLLLVAAAGLMASSSIASAQTLYYGGHVGINLTADTNITEPAPNFEGANFDAGAAFGGFIGYDLGTGIRVEGELTFRTGPIAEFTSIPGLAIDGGLDSTVLMANAFYDFNTGSQWTPYVGGGIGVAFMSADMSFFGFPLIVDEDTVFAYQLGAGVGYAYSPTITITADYRLLAADDPVFVDAGGIDTAGFEYLTHAFLIGVRTAF